MVAETDARDGSLAVSTEGPRRWRGPSAFPHEPTLCCAQDVWLPVGNIDCGALKRRLASFYRKSVVGRSEPEVSGAEERLR